MNRIVRYILATITFVTFTVTAKALIVLPDTIIFGNYPYVRFVEKGSDIDLSDNEFYNLSRKIVFPINKYDLPQNSAILKEIKDEVIPLLNKDSLSIYRMMIRGAASPEGPYNFNKMLGDKRGQSLFSFINSRLANPVKEDEYTREAITEDYQYLCIMMRDAGDADYLKVKEICDKYLPSGKVAALKSALQKADGGKLWRRLLKTYFPDLRATRFIIFLEKPEPEKTDAPIQIVQAQPVDEGAQTSGKGVMTLPETPVDTIQEPIVLKRREFLSVKTNLLLDGAYVPGYDRWCPIPNVAIEYYPLHGHFTFGASIDFPWWQDYWANKYFQIRNYQLEARYYLRSGDIEKNVPGEGAAFRGWYAQAYIHAGLFGICFDADRGWEGEGFGGGLGLGYVLPISRNGHWRLEFGAQAGFFRCKYDPFQFECPVDPTEQDHLYYYKWTLDANLFKKRQYRYNWIGPTRIGVTLTYDLLYRPVQKKRGASLRNWELSR